MEAVRTVVSGKLPVHVVERDPEAMLRHLTITSVDIVPSSDDDIDWDEAEWIDIED